MMIIRWKSSQMGRYAMKDCGDRLMSQKKEPEQKKLKKGSLQAQWTEKGHVESLNHERTI